MSECRSRGRRASTRGAHHAGQQRAPAPGDLRPLRSNLLCLPPLRPRPDLLQRRLPLSGSTAVLPPSQRPSPGQPGGAAGPPRPTTGLPDAPAHPACKRDGSGFPDHHGRLHPARARAPGGGGLRLRGVGLERSSTRSCWRRARFSKSRSRRGRRRSRRVVWRRFSMVGELTKIAGS
jgi:hypothetical protein